MKTHIVCAANKYELDGVEIIVTGARHCDGLMHATVDALSKCGDLKAIPNCIDNQGFIDQFGNWLDRVHAKAVVLDNDQSLRSTPESYELFSEDLY